MDVASLAKQGVDLGTQAVLYILLAGIIIAIIIIVIYIRSFKDTIILKRLARDRKIIEKTKCKDYIDDDGVPFLQTLKKVGGRRLHPLPPADAIELQSNGKRFIEAYVTETGELHYIRDKGFNKDDTSKILEAFTTKQRSILINQLKKAHERKGKSWSELIIPIVGIAALVIIVISLLIFYDNIAQPVLNMGDKQIQWEKEKTKQYEIWDRMDRNIQVIAKEVGINLAEEPPN